MPIFGTDTSDQAGKFACTSTTQRTLKDLRAKRKGQPVFVVGHRLERKGTEATFEVFNDRLAIIRFDDEVKLAKYLISLKLFTPSSSQASSTSLLPSMP